MKFLYKLVLASSKLCGKYCNIWHYGALRYISKLEYWWWWGKFMWEWYGWLYWSKYIRLTTKIFLQRRSTLLASISQQIMVSFWEVLTGKRNGKVISL